MPRLEVPVHFLTFTTYGTWLPGDRRGSVDLEHNRPGTPRQNGSFATRRRCEALLSQPPFHFDGRGRAAADEAIREVCTHRGWFLLALNLRTNHVHTVVDADAPGAKVMNDFKAYATRRLVRSGVVQPGRKVWTEGGSTRLIGSTEALERVCAYVMEQQGEDLDGAGAAPELGWMEFLP